MRSEQIRKPKAFADRRPATIALFGAILLATVLPAQTAPPPQKLGEAFAVALDPEVRVDSIEAAYGPLDSWLVAYSGDLNGVRYVAPDGALGPVVELPRGFNWPSVAASDDGQWAATGWIVGAQRYWPEGIPRGGVLPLPDDEEFAREVRIGSNGQDRYLAAWPNLQCGTEGTSLLPCSPISLRGRVLDREGAFHGPEFEILAKAWEVAVAGRDGEFVVVYQQFLAGIGGAHRYGADGQLLAGPVPLPALSWDVAIPHSSTVVVVGGAEFGPGEAWILDEDLSIRSGHLLETEPDEDNACCGAVASGPGGQWVAVWRRLATFELVGRWFGSDGSSSPPFVIADQSYAGEPSSVDVSFADDGTFLVTYISGPDGVATGVRYRSPLVFSDGFESGDTEAWSQTVR